MCVCLCVCVRAVCSSLISSPPLLGVCLAAAQHLLATRQQQQQTRRNTSRHLKFSSGIGLGLHRAGAKYISLTHTCTHMTQRKFVFPEVSTLATFTVSPPYPSPLSLGFLSPGPWAWKIHSTSNSTKWEGPRRGCESRRQPDRLRKTKTKEEAIMAAETARDKDLICVRRM